MRNVIWLCLAIAATGTSLRPVSAQALVKRGVQIEIVVCQGDPHGSRKAGTVEVLSAPLWLGADKESGRVFVGQSYPVADGTGGLKYVDIGVEVTATPRFVGDGYVRLEVEVKYSTARHLGGVPVIVAATGRLHGKYLLGEKIKLRMDEVAGVPVWAEIRAQVVTR